MITPRSTTLFVLGLHRLKLLLRDQVQFRLHRKQKLLVRSFLLLSLLELDLFTLFALGLLQSLLDLNLLLLLLPLLTHGDAALLDVVALNDFVVPEAHNFLLFVLLGTAQVLWHFLQVQRAVGLVTVGH